MGNRTAKFVSALVASVLAGAPLAAVSQDAPSPPNAAADDCLASPKATAPQGQHWYYRVERGTKRQCWYLRAEGAKTTQQGAQAAALAPAAETPARNVQDARAEWTPPAAAPETTASIPTPGNAATAQRQSAAADGSTPPAVAARWPDATVNSPSPAQQAAPATVADATPAPPSPAPLAAASAPVEKPTGSLQTLLLVVGAALALAGITGSVIYRFAGSRARVQARAGARRRVNWDNWERELEEARAPWLETAKPATPARAHLRAMERPRPVDFGFALAQAAKPAASASRLVTGETADETIKDIEPPEANETLIAFDIEQPEAPAEIRQPAPHADDEADLDADAVDIDAITAILERLAKEGPKLGQPAPTTGSAAFAQSRQDRSDVRA
jgi:hypothetical protein